jgi:hypothetical protein
MRNWSRLAAAAGVVRPSRWPIREANQQLPLAIDCRFANRVGDHNLASVLAFVQHRPPCAAAMSVKHPDLITAPEDRHWWCGELAIGRGGDRQRIRSGGRKPHLERVVSPTLLDGPRVNNDPDGPEGQSGKHGTGGRDIPRGQWPAAQRGAQESRRKACRLDLVGQALRLPLQRSPEDVVHEEIDFGGCQHQAPGPQLRHEQVPDLRSTPSLEPARAVSNAASSFCQVTFGDGGLGRYDESDIAPCAQQSGRSAF